MYKLYVYLFVNIVKIMENNLINLENQHKSKSDTFLVA